LKNTSSKLRQECANVAVMSQKVQAAGCMIRSWGLAEAWTV